MAPSFGPLVSVAWLRDNRGAHDLRVIDVRWFLDGRSGTEAHLRGHVPGASFIDLDADVTGTHGPGRHPLPGRAQFQESLRRAGVKRGDRIVVYDDQGGLSAARLWFLLRYFGHDAVALLDGGLQAWGDALEAGPVNPPPGDFDAAEPRREWIVDLPAVAGRPTATLLFDARAGERYRGEVEPLDSRPGHIPGAVNAPWKENLNPDLTFRSATALRRYYADLGIAATTTVIASCGSGVSACVNLVGLALAGLDGARLYEGSYSDWSAAPDTDVSTGTGN